MGENAKYLLKLERMSIFFSKFRWWGQRNCVDFAKPSTDETSKMQIDNVAGVFFILIGGVVFAATVCLAEYFAKRISNNVKKVYAFFLFHSITL